MKLQKSKNSKGKVVWWKARKAKPATHSTVKSGQRQQVNKPAGTKERPKRKKLTLHKTSVTAPKLISTMLSCSLARYQGRTVQDDLASLIRAVPKSPIGAMQADIPHDIVREYLLVKDIFKKYPGIPGASPALRRQNAIDSWNRCEAACHATNLRFLDRSSEIHLHFKSSSLVGQVVRLARQFIVDVLGEHPSLDVLYGNGRHGPGTSVGMTGNATTPYFKAGAFPITVTEGALPYMRTRLARDSYWFCAGVSKLLGYHFTVIPNYATRLRLVKSLQSHFFAVVPGDKVSFAPKDAGTERPITVSPLGNLFIQLGVDEYIRTRLKLFGIDLDTQEVNKSLALLGSLDPSWDSPVTIDLKTASEMIATQCVSFYLPAQWFAFLDDIRSPGGCLPKQPFKDYNKFSGMGNGFTFALESLIFVAIARAATIVSGGELKRVHIHGDDIICPKNAALLCWETLELSGFTVNTEKSYLHGPFRESCGTDGWNGADVRAIKVKDEVADCRDVFRLLNWTRKQIITFGHLNYVRHYQALLDLLTPYQISLIGPCTEDDGHIHCSDVFLTSYLRYNKRKQTFLYKSVIDVAKRYDRGLRKSSSYNGWAHGWSFLYQSQKGCEEDDDASKDASSITKRANTETRIVAVPLHGKPSIPLPLRQLSVTDMLIKTALEVNVPRMSHDNRGH